jgi:amidase
VDANNPFLTATQIVQAIRTRQVSAAEVLESQLAQIAKHNPALNAIVTLDEEGARQRAKEADEALARGESWGPLHGLPITIKDIFEVAGMRSTASYKPLEKHIPEQDASAVARLRAAGAIILGKTNLPVLASDFQTDSLLFGRTNNPWDVNRTPGGSTGGGGAAVAAGLSFLELGSDLAGSIRIPSHFCGVYGMTPTDGMVPKAGHLPRQEPGNTIGHLLRVGALARSIEDLQLCLSVIAGPDVNEPDLPPLITSEPAVKPLKALRIAWIDDMGIPITADTQTALQTFASTLADAGCQVERALPQFDFASARWLHNFFFFTTIGLTLPTLPRLLSRYLANVLPFALNLRRYLKAENQRMALITALDKALSAWDVWICPVTSTPAFLHHAPSSFTGPTPIYKTPIALDDKKVNYYIANTSFTAPLNVTGHPVIVMPIGQSKEGLPIGVQLVGKRWHDRELLGIAAQLAALTGPLRHPAGF